MTANHTGIPTHSNATDTQVQGPSVTCRFTVLTVNTHKGFTALNRRFILPELREAVRSVSADVVFLQEVHGTHEQHPKRYTNWPCLLYTSPSPRDGLLSRMPSSA